MEGSSINLQKHQELFKKRFYVYQRDHFFNPTFQLEVFHFVVNVNHQHKIIKWYLRTKSRKVLLPNKIHLLQVRNLIIQKDIQNIGSMIDFRLLFGRPIELNLFRFLFREFHLTLNYCLEFFFNNFPLGFYCLGFRLFWYSLFTFFLISFAFFGFTHAFESSF